MKPTECRKILKEIYRVLQPAAFVIINNYGYVTITLDNVGKVMGPEENEIITPETIKKLAAEVGFKGSVEIPFDPDRVRLGGKFVVESFPQSLHQRMSVSFRDGNALLIEK